MKKEYGYILIVYILMQLSALAAFPLLLPLGQAMGIDRPTIIRFLPGYWNVFSFSVALIIIWILLRKANERELERMGQPLSPLLSAIWAVAGVFLAMFAQNIAVMIETMLGIEMGSENTETIMSVVEIVPAMMIVVAIIGPILEEIVFRKVIFGSLYRKYSFWVSALISSAIFSIVHLEPEHFLIYASMGFTFAFLYVKTKRLIVPIFAHVAMNSLVILIQYFYADDIERIRREAEQIQSFAAWLLW
ncbi:CPBP family intramembrane glutamic endopeptidase [Bacillus thermotolerans]|uniref:CPBP family intramembrane glutamic endopeptidase n=1 Tax=Bacillus thermotolerans TaxID=1221996 RepID=UPI00057E6B16|nr:type II CAAX endopeptidase family protein [Bacillus thermotolerans]KKB33796.1 CAAX amino terminal protease family protein [Bacillus thermotolerans]KKB35444.1 CAAX amino terminal protease family protein [Bacillus thermotolerans]